MKPDTKPAPDILAQIAALQAAIARIEEAIKELTLLVQRPHRQW